MGDGIGGIIPVESFKAAGQQDSAGGQVATVHNNRMHLAPELAQQDGRWG